MEDASQEIIYMDYAATAPLCEEALDAMQPYLVAGTAGIASGTNANSLHSSGRAAYSALESARRVVARSIDARRPDEVIFTSGATEADNMAVFGIAQAAVESRKLAGSGDFKPHFITSAIEHPAVRRPAKRLEKLGFEVTFLRPTRSGFIDVSALEKELRPETVMVSIQMANSEVGSVQPVQELAAVSHDAGALFHTDATQAFGKVHFSVQELGVDAASISAHKIGGPKGVGALYLKARMPFQPQTLGGNQESTFRSGTQNICGVVGFAAAVEAAVSDQEDEAARLRKMRDELYEKIGALPQVEATVEVEPGSRDYLPNIANFLVRGIESETLVIRFDQLGIQVSGGSACSSQSLDPSAVLTAMGIQPDRALTELRFSIGRYTTEEDIAAAIEGMKTVINWEKR